MATLIVFALSMLAGCFVVSTEACSCAREPLQNVYCNAHFVLHVRITGRDIIRGKINHIKYMIDVLQKFRVGDGFEEADHTSIWSNAHGSACGVTDLQLGRTYLVTGDIRDRKLFINSCGWNAPWHSLTPFQEKAVKKMWKKQCKYCQIKLCHDCMSCHGVECNPAVLMPETPRQTCIINTSEHPIHCFDQYSVCQRVNGRCEFKKTPSFKNCLEVGYIP